MNRPGKTSLGIVILSATITLLSSPVLSENHTLQPLNSDCAVESGGTDDTNSIAIRLSCYNQKLDRVTDALSSLLMERQQIAGTLTPTTNDTTTDVSETISAQQKTIKQLRLERADLRSQLHRLLSEQQPDKLQKEVDESLFRSYSIVYNELTTENSELRKLLDELQSTTTLAEQENSQKSAEIVNLSNEVSDLKRTVADLSTRRKRLSDQFELAGTQMSSMKTQLLNNVALIQEQNLQITQLNSQRSSLIAETGAYKEKLYQARQQQSELIAQFDKDSQSLTEEIQRINTEHDETMVQVKNAELNTMATLGARDREIVALSDKVRQLGSSLDVVTRKLAVEKENFISTNEALNNEVLALTDKTSLLDAQRTSLQEQLTTSELTLQELKSESLKKRASINRLNEEVATLERELNATEAESENLLTNQNELIADNNRLTDQLTDATALLDSTQNDVLALTDKTSLLDAQRTSLQEQLTISETTLQELKSESLKKHASINRLNEEVATLERELNATETESENLLSAQNELIADNNRLADQLTDATVQLDSTQNERDQLTSELDVVKPALIKVTASLAKAGKDKQDLSININTLEVELDKAIQETSELQQALEQSQNQKTEALSKVSTLTKTVDNLEAILNESLANNTIIEASLSDIKSDLQASQQRLDTKQQELRELMAERAALLDAQNALAKESEMAAGFIRKHLKDAGVESVNVAIMGDQTLTLQVGSNQLFRTGSSKLSLEGQSILGTLGIAIAQIKDRRILIEGHSDNVPLGSKLAAIFTNNKGLSMARAVTAAEFFTNSADIPANNMSVSGAGDSKPLASNDTSEGRQQNRRVEILLLPAKSGKIASN